MKQKTKHLKLFLTFTILAGLLFTACQVEEDIVTDSHSHSPIKMRYLRGKEAIFKGKQVALKLSNSNKMRVNNRTDSFLNTSEGTVDNTKVLEVTDSQGYINYTFNIVNHPEDSPTVFHNLVVSTKPTGEEEVLLLKYTADSAFETLTEFRGNLTTKSILESSNPCDISTVEIDFTGNYTNTNGNPYSTPIATPTGTTTPAPPVIPIPPNLPTYGGGGNAGNSLADNIYVCNTPNCGFVTTSLGSIRSHDKPDGYTTIIINHRSSVAATNTNPCNPDGGIGVIKDDEVKTPCDDFNELPQKTGFNTRMTALKNNLSGPTEKAFTVRDDANNTFSDVVEGDADGNVNIFVNQTNDQICKTIGAGHNHLQNNPEHIGIFTPEDLTPLLTLGLIATSPDNPYQVPAPDKSFAFVLTNKGYFLMKINDVEKLKAFQNDYGTWTLVEKKKYIEGVFLKKDKYNINPDSTREELITGFLRFMTDKDLGVDLYEGDKDNYNNVQQLFLVDNGNGNYSFNKLPCQ